MDNAERTQTTWYVGIALMVMWFLGLARFYTFGGFLHVLLALFLVVLFLRAVAGRRPF